MAVPTPPIPGVPPLLNAGSKVANNAILVASDVALVGALLNRPKWGIYKGGKLVIEPDTIISFGYKQSTRIADYPQEAGAFESYNKIGTPFEARVQMTKGGSLAERTAFLGILEVITASLDLYDIVTPEKVYLSANIESADYMRKTAQGANMLTVEIRLVQIRIATQAQFSNTAQPSGADLVNAGTVQGQPATAAQTTPALAAAQAGP